MFSIDIDHSDDRCPEEQITCPASASEEEPLLDDELIAWLPLTAANDFLA